MPCRRQAEGRRSRSCCCPRTSLPLRLCCPCPRSPRREPSPRRRRRTWLRNPGSSSRPQARPLLPRVARMPLLRVAAQTKQSGQKSLLPREAAQTQLSGQMQPPLRAVARTQRAGRKLPLLRVAALIQLSGQPLPLSGPPSPRRFRPSGPPARLWQAGRAIRRLLLLPCPARGRQGQWLASPLPWPWRVGAGRRRTPPEQLGHAWQWREGAGRWRTPPEQLGRAATRGTPPAWGPKNVSVRL